MYKKGDKVRVVHPDEIQGLTTLSAYPALYVGQILTVAKDQVDQCNLEVIVGCEIVGYYPQRFVPATFTKADLKTGMRVQYRDGTTRVVINDRLWSSDVEEQLALKVLNDNLEDKRSNSRLTIMEVWAAPDKCEDFFNLDVKGVLLFERIEQPVKTQQELEYEQLMAKIEELKQQAEKLKPSA